MCAKFQYNSKISVDKNCVLYYWKKESFEFKLLSKICNWNSVSSNLNLLNFKFLVNWWCDMLESNFISLKILLFIKIKKI